MEQLIERIKPYQIIKIPNNPKKYARNTILIDIDIYYLMYRTAFMLQVNLNNGERHSTYTKYIAERITIPDDEFIARLETIKTIIVENYT
jgi:hypothetical protein